MKMIHLQVTLKDDNTEVLEFVPLEFFFILCLFFKEYTIFKLVVRFPLIKFLDLCI